MSFSIKAILKARDGMSDQAADDLIEEAREALYNHLETGDDHLAYEICAEYFGLEPDYLMDLMV